MRLDHLLSREKWQVKNEPYPRSTAERSAAGAGKTGKRLGEDRVDQIVSQRANEESDRQNDDFCIVLKDRRKLRLQARKSAAREGARKRD